MFVKFFALNRLFHFLSVCLFVNTFATPPLDTLVAQEIKLGLNSFPELNEEAFLQGFCSDQVNIEEKILKQSIFRTIKAKREWQAAYNLRKADEYFEQLKDRSDLTMIFPKKLYYRVIDPGTGCSIKSNASIKAIFNIETISKEKMCCRPITSEMLFVTELLPGIAKGIEGMRAGEIREMFIHPTLGYEGMYDIEENQALIAIVELLEICDQTDELPKIEPRQIIFQKPEEILYQEFQTLQKELSYQVGINVWHHYKWGAPRYYTREILVEKIKTQHIDVNFLDPVNRNAISHLHWEIYMGKKKI